MLFCNSLVAHSGAPVAKSGYFVANFGYSWAQIGVPRAHCDTPKPPKNTIISPKTSIVTVFSFFIKQNSLSRLCSPAAPARFSRGHKSVFQTLFSGLYRTKMVNLYQDL